MPALTLLAALAQAFSPLPAAPALHDAAPRAATIACNPDPSKNRGCFREADPAARRVAAAQAQKSKQTLVACHPDPSKNRGCLRPTFERKPAQALALAEAEQSNR